MVNTTNEEFYNHEWSKIIENQNHYKNNQLLIKLRWLTISYMISEYVDFNIKNHKLIDLGCGDGTTLNLLKSKFGIKGDGLEFSRIAAQETLSKGFKVFENSIEDDLPIESESYDIILCSEVIEHLRYPQYALKNIYRILTPEGFVIFSLPNLGFIKNRLKLLLGRNPLSFQEYELSFHLHHWTFRSWKKFLLDNQFKNIKLEGAIPSSFLGRILLPIRPSLFSYNIFCVAKKN